MYELFRMNHSIYFENNVTASGVDNRWVGYAFYDANKSYINGSYKSNNYGDTSVGYKTFNINFNVPIEAKYIRVSWIISFDYKIKLEKSDTPTTYLPSKSDNYRDSFMKYIGYSVKNSINPADYRWAVNPEWQRAQVEYEKSIMVKDKLINLIKNADFSLNIEYWSKSSQVLSLSTTNNILTVVKNDGIDGSFGAYQSQALIVGNKYYVCAEFKSSGGYQYIRLFDNEILTKPVNANATIFNKISKIAVATSDMAVRFYTWPNQSYDMRNPIIYDLTSIFGAGNEPTLEEFERLLAINVNSPTIYSQSILKAKLNSSPINSILTTLSQENPSTTLGGTWVQLGTESKFNNTIYYWKRTN